jgi:hypothetical protein
MKFLFFISFQFGCVCNFLQAQTIYYNKTQDVGSTFNSFADLIVLNQDTLLAEGFLVDNLGHRFRNFTYVNLHTGDTISSFKYARDTMNHFGGLGSNLIIKENVIYFCGALYDGQLYANFLKFNLNGDLLLDSLYNPTNFYSRFDCILPTDDGNFIILGLKEVSFGNLDSWLVKMAPNGNILWEQTYGGPEINGSSIIVKTNDDSYIISSSKKTAVGADIYIIKVDGSGNIIWDKVIDNTVFAESANISQLNNGDLLITGYNQFDNNKYKAWLSRLDSGGNLIWEYFFEKSIVFSGINSFINSLELTNGNLIVFGCVSQFIDNFNPKGMLYCFSPKGDSLWSRYYKIRNNDNYIQDLKLLNNGDFLMAGYVWPDSQDNTQDGWLMRTNCLGYFEHPKDSIVMSGIGENVLSLTNYSSYYDYTIVNWGDNSSDTVYASGNQNIMHEYTLPGNYSINTTTIACNDTIHKSSEYLVIPEQYESSELVIFPNPNQGHFEIWLDSPDLYSLEIMDLNGRIVKSALNVKMNQGYIIDLSELGSSIYFVRAAKDENIIQQRVLVIR